MPLEIRNANFFGHATQARLTKFEKAYGCDLPSEYRTFIMKYNGGRPTYPLLLFVNHGREEETVVEWFFALHDEPYDEDSEDEWLDADGVLPSHFKKSLQSIARSLGGLNNQTHRLPIARDPAGNMIILVCDGPDRGRVYYLDHEQPKERVPLAASFNSFLKLLQPLIDDEDTGFDPWIICQSK